MLGFIFFFRLEQFLMLLLFVTWSKDLLWRVVVVFDFVPHGAVGAMSFDSGKAVAEIER